MGAASAAAGTFNFNGTLFEDDQVSFLLTMNSPAVVTIATGSYATGGFAPVLSIFSQPLLGPGPFVDPSNPNLTDTGSDAVSFQNVDNVVLTPEPAGALLLFGGAGAALAIGERSRVRQ